MKKLLVVLAVMLLGAVTPHAAAGAILIDFSYHGLNAGALTLSTGGQVSTTNVPITGMSVNGAPQGNGVYDVVGGILAFDTLARTISIEGTVKSGDQTIAYGTLLSGTVESFLLSPTYNGQYLLSLFGTDSKNIGILEAVGLPADTKFGHFGFVALVNPTVDGTFETNSVDINNTVVPEPGSMLLLGSGLIGLAGAARRRFAKK